MIIWPYNYKAEVRSAVEFIEEFKVKELFNKLYDADFDKELDIYDLGSDEEIIEALLLQMEGYWNYEYRDVDNGVVRFNIYELDVNKLKQQLLKIFPKDYFTDKFISSLVADKV